MLDKEYILFCDESDKFGKFYSNFYGGLLGSKHYDRITARLNAHVPPKRLSPIHFEVLNPYAEAPPILLRIYLDKVADTKERLEQFKGYIRALPRNKNFMAANFKIPEDHVTEVRSHEHVLLQCIDVVLGAMTFRLNEKHKEKLPGTKRREKRMFRRRPLLNKMHF